jgi:hypothetical protein
VTITNAPIFVFSIYMLLGVHQQEIRSYADNPPAPGLWTVFYDNPHFSFALVLTGAGLLLEAINRREAALINCGFWLALSIYNIAQGEPAFANVVFAAIFVVEVLWYVLPIWRKRTENPRFDSSGP